MIILAKAIFATKYLIVVLALILGLVPHGHAAEAPISAVAPGEDLSLSDCSKCHPTVVETLKKNGKAHRDKLTCQDCHVGHRPKSNDVIPLCSRCHKDTPHFALEGCLGCHTNPHTPLEITLTRTVTSPCTTCHHGQLEQLRDNPSIHTTLDCTACHTRHGYLPPCYNCHAAHLEGMANKLCQECHKPHMPLQVSFPAEIPAEYCGPCHPEPYNLLAKSRAKHRNVPCAQCHAGPHKTIPICQKCHPAPHSESILGPKPVCGACHGIAHDLKLDKIDILLDKQGP